jgi:hypothetical protein
LLPLFACGTVDLPVGVQADGGADASVPDVTRPPVEGGLDAGQDAPDAPDVFVERKLVVSAPSGPATNEAGGAVTFTVALSAAPLDARPVKVAIVSSVPTEGKVDKAELTFDATNWSTPQTVTVTGVDDSVRDGDKAYVVNVGPAVGVGSGYDGATAAPVALKNEDDDIAGIFVSAVAGMATEAGGTATFTVRLRTQPTEPVTVPVASSDLTEGTTDVTMLTFDAANWNVPQTVTVTGVDDAYDDGDVTYPITLGASTSVDPNYQGVDAADPMVTTNDDDTAALVLGPLSGPRTNELGASVTFDVMLAARPTSNVTVPVTSLDTTEGVASPATLTFTTDNWNTPQTVTVTGQADALVDGAVTYAVRAGLTSSADAPFANLMAMVSIINDDNPLPNYSDFSINHILSSGQSNSTANGGTQNDSGQGFPNFTFTPVNPTYSNLSFDTGVFVALGCTGGGCGAGTVRTPASFVPIQEGDRFLNYNVETISSAMANRISQIALANYFGGTPYTKHDVLVSQHGRSGFNYACIRKGGCAYQVEGNPSWVDGMSHVDAGVRLAAAAGRSYVVRAATFIHGEDDHYSYGPLYPWPRRAGGGNLANYAEALDELQKDYDTDIKARTGQAQTVPLFITQMHGWTNTAVPSNDPDYIPPTSSPIPIQQWWAHRDYPNVVMVAPTYMLRYNDCLHYNGFGQRRVGEYMAKAYAKWVFEGVKWQPVSPTSVTRAANVVTVRFHVPVPPLVLDTVNITNPGNFGFRYLVGGNGKIASGTPQTITSVVVSAPDTVTITLQNTPVGANQRLEYANYFDFNGTGRPGCPGPQNGVRGNLRDSDPAPSVTGGVPLHNWAVSFEAPVP